MYIASYIYCDKFHKSFMAKSTCGAIHPHCTHGDHPSLLYTWGPSIPIVHIGTIHLYCTHGDHPSLLYTWGPSIPIVHIGTIHLYCTHGDHPSLLYTWGPSIPIVHMGTIHPYCTHGDHPSLLYTRGGGGGGGGHRTPVPMWKWWGLYCHIVSLPLLAPLTHHLLMSSLWL